MTSFVGRGTEPALGLGALRRSRLVTLTGPGGVGKTRLALRLASEAGAELADGAWLVELSALQDGASLAATLLRSGPGLRIVVTTRQPLGLPGECVLPVEPTGTAEGGDAMELLAVRAAEAVPGSTMDLRNRDAVVALCRHLDGIPLAIELAAVRMRAYSVEQLLQRLLPDRAG